MAKELEADIADAMGRAKWTDVYNGALKARNIFLEVDIEYRYVYIFGYIINPANYKQRITKDHKLEIIISA